MNRLMQLTQKIEKNRRYYQWVCLIILLLIQGAIFTKKIVTIEQDLQAGNSYLFLLQPVDPYDAFRGRYISLRFNVEEVKGEAIDPNCIDASRNRDRSFYIWFENDSEGFAYISHLSCQKPTKEGFMEVKLSRSIIFNKDGSPDAIYVKLPFARFYLQEELAMKSDRLIRRLIEDHKTYAKIRIGKNGNGVLENVFVDQVPITDFLKGMPEQ